MVIRVGAIKNNKHVVVDLSLLTLRDNSALLLSCNAYRWRRRMS